MEKFEDKNWEIEKEDWGEYGKFKKGSESPGWVFGSFRNKNSLASTEVFEIKYWSFKKGQSVHEPKFQVTATEYNFIIKGKIIGRIGDKKGIILGAGDYVVVKPGEIINLQQEVVEDTEGITIKIPSRHGDTIKKGLVEKLLNFEK